jgi:hypothetical protein
MRSVQPWARARTLFGRVHAAPANEPQAAVELALERPAVDRFASLACAGGVTSLDNEVLDDAVEDGVIVVALHAELRKVSASLQTHTRSLCQALHRFDCEVVGIVRTARIGTTE